jgi:hypothetical protein
MKHLKLYLETSVWNFLFADDAIEKRAATEMLFMDIENKKYDVYISDIVIDEVKRASAIKQRLLLKAINKYRPTVLEISENSRVLIQHYLRNDVLSVNHLADLGHVAVASVNEMDVLVSWNMRHIVKLRTRIMVNAANQLYGFDPLEICSPEEVIDYEDA